MNAFVNELTTGITADTLFAQITPLAGLIVTLTLFGFAIYVLNKNIRRGTKGGKGKVA